MLFFYCIGKEVVNSTPTPPQNPESKKPDKLVQQYVSTILDMVSNHPKRELILFELVKAAGVTTGVPTTPNRTPRRQASAFSLTPEQRSIWKTAYEKHPHLYEFQGAGPGAVCRPNNKPTASV